MQAVVKLFLKYGAGAYRYGFNGKEKDKDGDGGSLQIDYGFRIYDPHLGRFKSVDPITAKYPELSPYQFASNRPIDGIDMDGLEFIKKDNTNYRLDYKPVLSSPNVGKGLGNAVHNAIAFIWNGTLGAAGEGIKSVNNYFAGGYKEPQGQDLVGTFNNATHEMGQYWSNTSSKQIVKDFGNAATDLTNYEIIPSLIIAHKFYIPEVGIASSREIIGARVNVATDFYKKSDFSPGKALSHMEGINFEKAVQTTTLKKGTIIQQWVGENGVGNYFTSIENGAAKNLGMSYEGRTLQQFTLGADVKVLKSTAAEYKGNAGGGTQFFSTELKSKVTPTTTP